MTRLEELEEQARHLNDKVRTKRRKAEEMKNELRVKFRSIRLKFHWDFVFVLI